MQKLVDGVHRFQHDVFSTHERFFKRLVEGQKPLALFITCSDSRIDPNMITQTEPGELFILRNAGNIVPTYSNGGSGEAATIEYAVAVLGVQDVIVCGHSHCGAMAALLDPSQVTELPSVRSWLGHAEATSRIIRENYSHITEPRARLTATDEENVLVQRILMGPGPSDIHPSVLAAMGRKELRLHGWVYKFETGQVFAFNPQHGQFESVGDQGFEPRPIMPHLRTI